jgi:CxxC-x17-CxxC domain-containing protein
MPFGGGFRRGGFRKRRFNGPREMTKITCAECGKEDEVPFKPREGSKVLCKECFLKSKGITPREKSEGAEEEPIEEGESMEEDQEEAEEEPEEDKEE